MDVICPFGIEMSGGLLPDSPKASGKAPDVNSFVNIPFLNNFVAAFTPTTNDILDYNVEHLIAEQLMIPLYQRKTFNYQFR